MRRASFSFLVVSLLLSLGGCNTPDTTPIAAYVPTGRVKVDGSGTAAVALAIPRQGHNLTIERAFREALTNLHYTVVPDATTVLVINVIQVKMDDHSPSSDTFADSAVTIDVHVRSNGVDGRTRRFTSWYTFDEGQILIAGAYQATMTDAVSDVVDQALSDPDISAALHNELPPSPYSR